VCALGIERFAGGECASLSERCADPAHERFARASHGHLLLADHATLMRHRTSLGRYEHLFLLDPPRSPAILDALVASGGAERRGFVQLGWGEPEVEFARRVLEGDFSLREPLRAIYAELRRSPEGLAGPALEALLAGPGAHPRKPATAGRCLQVLAELGLVEIERSSATVRCTITEAGQVELEASETFTACERVFREGLEYLSAQTVQASQRRAA
jgi:hypothetical protein